MAQWLKTFTTLAEDLGLAHNFHNSTSRRSNNFCFLRAPGTHDTHTHT